MIKNPFLRNCEFWKGTLHKKRRKIKTNWDFTPQMNFVILQFLIWYYKLHARDHVTYTCYVFLVTCYVFLVNTSS